MTDVQAPTPRLQDVLARTVKWHLLNEAGREQHAVEVGAKLAAAWREACMISTVEQLDTLPIGAVLLSLGGSDIGDIYANWADHHLASLYGPWFRTGYEVPCPSDEVDLPALLVWSPDWSVREMEQR